MSTLLYLVQYNPPPPPADTDQRVEFQKFWIQTTNGVNHKVDRVGIFKQSMEDREPSRNRVIVPVRQATFLGINSWAP